MYGVKTYLNFDIAKYILSIMIILIHSGCCNFLFPWLRIAVPLFFMISSYLFFKKYNKDLTMRKILVRNYIVRNLKYYLFWFIVLFPVTIYDRRVWLAECDNNICFFIIKIISNTLFSSTFVASWFIISSIWAIYILHKTYKINDFIMIPIICIIYLICLQSSSYSFLFQNFSFIMNFKNTFEKLFFNPVFSFPIALCWMYIGKLFALKYDSLNNSRTLTSLGILISSILLFFEHKIIAKVTLINTFDVYFMLVPLCFFLFKFILSLNLTCNINLCKLLRRLSILFYPMHTIIIKIVKFLMQVLHCNSNVMTLLMIILLCHIIAIIILKLEKITFFKFLRYSH